MKSIKYKVLLGFSIILLILVALSSYVFVNIMNFNKEVEQVVEKDLEILLADQKLSFNMSQRIALARGYVLFGDPSYKESFDQYTQESKLIQSQILALSDSDKAKPFIDASIEWRQQIQEKVFDEYDRGNKEQALNYLENEGTEVGREIMDGFNELSKTREEIIVTNSKNLVKNGVTLETVTLILTVLSIVLGIIIALVISRMLIKPIIQVVDRVKTIAKGDLTGKLLEVKTKDEMATLSHSINEMVVNLRGLVHQVQETSDQVAATSEELTASAEQSSHASEEITSNIQELASGSEHQAKQVENASETINQMIASVTQVSANTDTVTATVDETAVKTKEGSQAINQSVNQMNEIANTVQNLSHVVKGLGEQSREIGEIVTVITGIADQTNLLALNAAIEAARAGEHGKGFAVVADEVRKLAEESAKSSKEIAQLVSTIQSETSKAITSMDSTIKEVDNGIETAKIAGDSFQHIREAINTVTGQVKEVSTAMKEMSAGTETVLQSIHAVAQIAEESAAGTQNVSASSEEQLASMEEITASATNLSHMAEELSRQIGRFKI
ncbi:methyl-accepting chemotaxis protein [Bacillus mesophilus]|uniref:Methyl-accepting chemotaxis protein n=2 Tax=Bacillus mesophilus TaxID=1808955 RepID=A0A6M0Q4A5_9BACI|nr:methyl-accepting chemotaxis protein [Bacillus mesophilus]MBM7660333.1 methyl-accepting chemotaxis protein [Bacillus mesophilus]NEY71044.1 methyl-accepting chemotaxis protein [Bacillus mesophilus]